jgi:hypothetical protein
MRVAFLTVMPMLVTGIHAFVSRRQGVNGRSKSGQDNGKAESRQIRASQSNRSL